MKKCNTCNITKDIVNFRKRSDRDGKYESKCIDCCKEYRSRKYIESRDEISKKYFRLKGNSIKTAEFHLNRKRFYLENKNWISRSVFVRSLIVNYGFFIQKKVCLSYFCMKYIDVCTSCIKPMIFTMFNKDQTKKSGRSGDCKYCCGVYSRNLWSKNRDVNISTKKLQRDELHDIYIIELLTKRRNLNKCDIPNDLIDLHRANIKLSRFIKENDL